MGFIRKKIFTTALHALGWILVFTIIQYLVMQEPIALNPVKQFFTWGLLIGLFYLNYLVFVPLLFPQKRLILYLLICSTSLVVIFFSVKYLTARFPDTINFSAHAQLSLSSSNYSTSEFRYDLPTHAGTLGIIVGFMILAISTSIRVTQNLYLNEEQRKEIQNEKLSAELLFLKSQINPHFFFNTLNSIYYLAHTKSDQSPVAILKLSEIMRYIIYEAVKDKVPLAKEMDYIQNYIDLQRLRLNDNVSIEFVVHLGSQNYQIGPMLLIPFVENAFKHGIDYTQTTTISISAIMEDKTLHFCVKNPNIQQNRVNLVSSGVGLKNVKKRLELLYPSNFQLFIREEQLFTVDLYLNLAPDELHNS